MTVETLCLVARLSPRERQVLLAYTRHEPPTETAAALGISVVTVYRHRQNIRRRLWGERIRGTAAERALAEIGVR